MPQFDPVQSNFTAGELSPYLMGNFQIDKYKQGLKTLENMIVQPHGGISRRGGFKYIAEVKDSSKTTILHEFKFKNDFSYILEFGDQYIRFYRNQAQIMDNGSAYEVATTYLEAELNDLRFAQDEDTLYIVHKNHLPAQLTRTGHAVWTLANISFSYDGVLTVDTIVEPTTEVWTERTSSANNNWKAICWSPELELFVTVANLGTNRIMTSPDGVTWTTRLPPEDNFWNDVCWSPDLALFCAVAYSGTNRIMTSPDGVTWTAQSAGAETYYSVCWSPELGLFCAVGNNVVRTSTDGVTWTSRTPVEANPYNKVCWSPELTLFVAVSSTHAAAFRVMTSPDGTNWTGRAHAGVNAWISVCWSPELTLFVAVSTDDDGSGQVMTSPDGTTWTQRTTPTELQWFDVCWSPEMGLFCAVAITGVGNGVMTSADGTTWATNTPANDSSWYGVCWSPELAIFCAVAASGTGDRVMTGYYGLVNGTYTLVVLTGGNGSGCIVTVVVASNAISTITPTTAGTLYEINDTLSIEPSDIGGNSGPITCDVATLTIGDIPAEWVATNYPTLAWFFEQRFWLAATPGEPNQVWGSRTANYDNLYTGTGLANDAIDIKIKEAFTLLWVTTSEVILLGGHNAVFRLSANNLNEAITPTNIRAPKVVSYGSAFLPAIDLDGNVVFIQRGLRKVRRLEYEFSKDRYKATDISILSSHITESGLTDIAYSDEPNAYIWGVRTDGQLICLTYEPEYGVFGWSRHILGGTDVFVKSIAVSDAITADEDELWAIVSRTIDGSTVQYIEFLKQGLTLEDDQYNAFFVESGLSLTTSSFTFTAKTSAEQNAYRSICWSPALGLFCAISSDGLVATQIMTSPDGTTWTARTSPEENQWISICWSPELAIFCAVSIDGTNRVMTSPDGITWNVQIASEASNWYSICWSPELQLFCVVSSDVGTKYVMTSPDGIVWTSQTAVELNTWNAICWSPELRLFCAVSSDGANRVMTSPDGITWTSRIAVETNQWRSVCWSPELELFCAVADSGTYRVMTSPDGIVWTGRTAAEQNSWRGICWSPELGLFCAVSLDGTNQAMTSYDGITWTARAESEATTWLAIAWSPELMLLAAIASSGTDRVMVGPSTTETVSGLDHLEGETVVILGNGLVQDPKVVSSGDVSVVFADILNIGLPYTSIIETLPLEGGNPIGSAMGKIKRIVNVVLRLYKSLIFTIGDIVGGDIETVDLGEVLFTGDTDELDFYGDYETGGQMKITVTDPVPFTLLAIMYEARTRE